MKKRLFFFGLVIIAVVAIVLLIATKISPHPDEVTVIKKMEINREQKKEEDLSAQEKQPAAEKKYVEGEVLVKFKKGTANEEIKAFLAEYKLRVLDVIKGINVFRLRTPKDAPFKEILDKLNKDSRIEYAEPNYIFKIN